MVYQNYKNYVLYSNNGYMSPEYALKGVFSVKSDVYSFGVLILEIVSGSKISSVHLKADFSSIIAYAVAVPPGRLQ